MFTLFLIFYSTHQLLSSSLPGQHASLQHKAGTSMVFHRTDCIFSCDLQYYFLLVHLGNKTTFNFTWSSSGVFQTFVCCTLFNCNNNSFPDLLSVQLIVVWLKGSPSSHVDLCSSTRVTMDLFVAFLMSGWVDSRVLLSLIESHALSSSRWWNE